MQVYVNSTYTRAVVSCVMKLFIWDFYAPKMYTSYTVFAMAGGH